MYRYIFRVEFEVCFSSEPVLLNNDIIFDFGMNWPFKSVHVGF